ncbi:MAG: hypothetical protein UY76_C0033G0006, partial [Candidatus Uhrbacteria bacterium GW2011_GWA2_52_8d]
MTISDNHLTRTLGVLLSLALISPLFFWPSVYAPFSSPTLIGFLFFVELSLPVYLILATQRNNPLTYIRQPTILALIVLTLILILTSFTGVDRLNSFLGTIQRPLGIVVWIHGLIFVLALLELFARDVKWKSHTVTLVILMATLICLYALGEGWIWPAFVGNEGRVGSILGNPTFLASFLILPCFFSFARSLESTKKTRLFLALAGGLMLVVILQTGTRGALLGLIAGFIVWAILWLWSGKKTMKQKASSAWKLSAIALATLLSLWIMSPSSVFERLTSTDDENIHLRLIYWDMAVDGWLDHPVLGVGPGNFYVVADPRFTSDLYAYTNVWPDKPHNTLLEYLATSGLLGGLAWLTLLGLLVRRTWRQRQHPASFALLAGLVAYTVQGLFFFDGISDWILFLFLVAWLGTAPPARTSHPRRLEARESQNRALRNSRLVVGGLGVLMMVVGITTLILPLRAQVVAAGKNELPQTGIVIDDMLVSKTASTRASETTTDQPDRIDEALTLYARTIARHPLRQAEAAGRPLDTQGRPALPAQRHRALVER